MTDFPLDGSRDGPAVSATSSRIWEARTARFDLGFMGGFGFSSSRLSRRDVAVGTDFFLLSLEFVPSCDDRGAERGLLTADWSTSLDRTTLGDGGLEMAGNHP